MTNMAKIVIIANTQLMIRNMNVEQVRLKAFLLVLSNFASLISLIQTDRKEH